MAQSRPSELPSSSAMLSSVFGCHPSEQRLAASRGLIEPQAARAQLQRFSQSSAMPDEVAAQMQQQARQFYLQVRDRSSLANSTDSSSGEVMEMDETARPRQEHPGSPALVGGALNMQASAGLMRYHSAPSSMLSSLVEISDEFFSTGSSSLTQVVADSEFARFFRDDLAPPATAQFESTRAQSDKSRALSNHGGGGGGLEAEQRRLDASRSISQHSRFKRATANGIVEEPSRVPLSAILEHAPEVNSENFCGHNQILLSCSQQGAPAGVTVGVGSLVSDSGSPVFPPLSESKSNLIRHSSSPAGLLSRLAMEVQNETSDRSNPCFSGPLMHPSSECLPESTSAARAVPLPSSFPMSCFAAGRVPSENSDDLVTAVRLGVSSKGGLLRHSSSPAGLLSQLNLDVLADGEKLILPSSSGNSSEDGSVDRRAGPAFLGNNPWDDSVGNVMVGSPNGASFAARKRIRELDDKYFATSALTDPQHRDALEHGASLANQFNLQTATSPENPYSPDKLSSDSVACRARAKRGCATHPRSIAERVRRMKISERMRKLQELVPNMDKQTNTADMLDEAVEYVKALQRQVQELTENRQNCDCACKQKGTASK